MFKNKYRNENNKRPKLCVVRLPPPPPRSNVVCTIRASFIHFTTGYRNTTRVGWSGRRGTWKQMATCTRPSIVVVVIVIIIIIIRRRCDRDRRSRGRRKNAAVSEFLLFSMGLLFAHASVCASSILYIMYIMYSSTTFFRLSGPLFRTFFAPVVFCSFSSLPSTSCFPFP